VRYRERQRLTTADLRLEQTYRLALAGRHHVSHHEWGVVRGLRVLWSAGTATLTPGIAIDGYGREIFVPEPVPLVVKDPEGCAMLALYYCEYDAQTRSERTCEDVPAPRIAQRFTWVLEENLQLIDEPERLALARAAGRLRGEPPWPVPIALIGAGCAPPRKDDELGYVDYRATRYVRHRASLVRSPNDRALLQLGLTSRSDVYQLLLSTRDGGVLNRRLAIDRDGVTHVWRPLVIAGAYAEGQALIAKDRVLKVSGPASGGIGARVRFEGRLDPVTHTLTASMIEIQSSREHVSAFTASKRFDAVKALALDLVFGGVRITSFRLVNEAGQGIPFRSPRPRPARARAVAETVAFSVEAAPAGGRLSMQKADTTSRPVAPPACGDVDRTRADGAGRGTPVIQFLPAVDIVPNPLSREVHAVTTSKPADLIPKTELRISGGAEDESDTSSRVSVGAAAGASGKWLPVLQMDGGRRLELLAVEGAPRTSPILAVTGTVYLPPIGKKDPLLPDLLSLAFISGLRQIGKISPDVTLTLANLPLRIVRGGVLTYKVRARWSGPVQVKRCFELITGTSGYGDMAFRTITGIDLPGVGNNSEREFTIEFPNFTHAADRVRIEIQMLVARDNTTTVAMVTSPDISVGA